MTYTSVCYVVVYHRPKKVVRYKPNSRTRMLRVSEYVGILQGSKVNGMCDGWYNYSAFLVDHAKGGVSTYNHASIPIGEILSLYTTALYK